MHKDAARDPVVVRALRRGEERLWYGCRLRPRRRAPSRPRRFTRDDDFVGERHLLALRGERVVGRMEWLRHGDEAALCDPVVVPGEDVAEVAGALLAEGLRRASRRDPKVIAVVHEKIPYADRLTGVLAHLGFALTKRRFLHRRRGRPPREVAVPGVTFVRARGLLDPPFVETLARASGDSIESVRRELRASRAIGRAEWRRFEIAMRDGRPVGVVLPAFLVRAQRIGTMDFVGVVPEARGLGIGRALTVRAIRALAAQGMREMKDATDEGNDAMLAVFRRTGYRLLDVQRYFGRSTASA